MLSAGMLREGLSYHLDEGNAQAMPSPPSGLTLSPVAISFQSCRRPPALTPNNKHMQLNMGNMFPAKWLNVNSIDGHFEITVL